MSTTDRPTQLGPFGFQFHQVAMYTSMIDEAVERYTDLGFKDWTWDTAALEGVRIINGEYQDVSTTATLAFNYDILPIEMEFLQYDSKSEHRHRERAQLTVVPFISHMSVHVESVQDTMARMLQEHNMRPYHLFVTDGHTNPAVRGKKRFVECVYDTRADLGYDIKCIERIAWDSDLTALHLLGPVGA